jgi:hypothetical protein
VIYAPDYAQSARLVSELKLIAGTPQPIVKIRRL